jgi:hypothetical protein
VWLYLDLVYMFERIRQQLFKIYPAVRREKKCLIALDTLADFENVNPVIEFLGPSGIGKSYYLYRLRDYDKGQDWMNFYEYFRFINSRYILQYGINSEHSFLLEKAHNRVYKTNLCVYDKFKIFTHLKSVTEQDHLLRVVKGDGAKVLIDEGVFLNYYVELLELAQSNRMIVDKFLSNRAFIFFEASPDYILKNIREREGKGRMMELHADLDDQGIINFSQDLAEKFRQYQLLFDKYEVPYLKIKAENDFINNIETISHFIKSVSISQH